MGNEPLHWDRLREIGSLGSHLLFEARRYREGRPTLNRLLVGANAGASTSDLVPQLEGNTSCGRVSPHGQRLAFLHDVGDGYWPWYEVVMVTQDRAVIVPFDRDLWVAGPPLWSPDGKLAVPVREGVRIGLLATDLDSGERWWLLRPQGVPTDVVLAPGARSAEVTLHDFGAAPRRACVGDDLVWLEEERPPPEWTSHCALTVVRWRSREAALEGLLATPRDQRPPFPLVVDIHGGPSFSLLATRMPPLHEWTARGFAAFAPEYRASGIAGREAMLAAAEWRPGPDRGTDLHDILEGVESLVERGVADPQKLFLYGFSYGAVLVNRLVTTDTRFAAAVSHEGIADLQLRRRRYGPDRIPDPCAPVRRVATITTPLLLVSGGDAPNREQAEVFAEALSREGKPVELRIFQGESHELRQDENIRALYDESVAWFQS